MMADDRTKKGVGDRTRINMNERYEVDYWKKKFRVSGQALAGAIRATGSSSVKKVEAYLKAKAR
jgi:Protein of unknown function (DUF3606)